jgi:hypothetical protein
MQHDTKACGLSFVVFMQERHLSLRDWIPRYDMELHFPPVRHVYCYFCLFLLATRLLHHGTIRGCFTRGERRRNRSRGGNLAARVGARSLAAFTTQLRRSSLRTVWGRRTPVHDVMDHDWIYRDDLGFLLYVYASSLGLQVPGTACLSRLGPAGRFSHRGGRRERTRELQRGEGRCSESPTLPLGPPLGPLSETEGS